MQRVNREFCLTDDSVNCYGYRLLTAGLQLDKYRPPVGFLMHEREKGVAVAWTDFRVEGDALFATPIINDTLFPDLAKQIEEGFIAAASVGHIVALEVSDDPEHKLPGQTGPTVTKWYPREVSLVDIPGNPNALARLYDENDNLLHDLSAARPKTDNTMNLSEIFPDLAQTASDDEKRRFLTALRDKAARADELQAKLDALMASTAAAEVKTILDAAVAEHRLTRQMADRLAADYAQRPDSLRDIVSLMPPLRAVPGFNEGEDAPTNAELAAEWDALDKAGALAELKKLDPDRYALLYDARFGHLTSSN